MESIAEIIQWIEADRIRRDLFYVCACPLPFRTANRTLPGHRRSTLAETDEFLEVRLEQLGYKPWKETAKAQAFRFDGTRPRRSAHGAPRPEDPWYELQNI